jgi:hypothetical protein
VIVGGEVFTGTAGRTAAVAEDSAPFPCPKTLLTVSFTLSLCPTSSATGT